jgi:RNA-directed DNA polymerase
MRREPHVRFCERAAVKLHRATHLIVGFQHKAVARRFLEMMRARLKEFSLSLHPDKTRLIEFGRFAAANRKRPGRGI